MARSVPSDVTTLLKSAESATTCANCNGHRAACPVCRGDGFNPHADLESQLLIQRLSRALRDAYGMP